MADVPRGDDDDGIAGRTSKLNDEEEENTGVTEELEELVKKWDCRKLGCKKTYKSRSSRPYHEERCTATKSSPKKKSKPLLTDDGKNCFKCRYCKRKF